MGYHLALLRSYTTAIAEAESESLVSQAEHPACQTVGATENLPMQNRIKPNRFLSDQTHIWLIYC